VMMENFYIILDLIFWCGLFVFSFRVFFRDSNFEGFVRDSLYTILIMLSFIFRNNIG